MASVVILPAAESDLDGLYEIDEDSAAEIETALDEIANDPRLAENLCRSGFFNLSCPHYDVSRVAVYAEERMNVLRLKFWDFEGALVPYRALYAYHPQKDTYYVLAVAERNLAYERDTELAKRIDNDFSKLDIPPY